MEREMKLKIWCCRQCPNLDFISSAEYVEYWCNKTKAKTGKQFYEIDCLKHLDRMFENCTVWEKIE